jgi:hypothetical protein
LRGWSKAEDRILLELRDKKLSLRDTTSELGERAGRLFTDDVVQERYSYLKRKGCEEGEDREEGGRCGEYGEREERTEGEDCVEREERGDGRERGEREECWETGEREEERQRQMDQPPKGVACLECRRQKVKCDRSAIGCLKGMT